ncbi:MAG: undecaprenyl diphosphate synthase family protein, partial [Pontimonas sp.]
SAYAELVFLDNLWPDMNRGALWDAIAQYQTRARRFGGAVDQPKPGKKASS